MKEKVRRRERSAPVPSNDARDHGTGGSMTEQSSARRRLTGGGIVLAWCAVVAVAATAGWVAVDRAGVSLLGASGPGLSGGVDTAGRPAVTSAVAGPVATLATTGGRVTATCTAARSIALQSATPAQSWRVEVAPGGAAQLKVEFRRGARGVEVQGVCRAGAAVLTVVTSAHGTTTPRSSATARSSAAPTAGGDRHGGGGSGSGGSGKGSSGGDSGGHSSGGDG
jgi:hypothetical protein